MAAAGIKPESQVSGIMISEKTKPASTRVCCLKTEIFSSSLAYRPHVSSENGHQKRSPEWRFLETPAYRFCVDRQKRRFFEYGDVIHKTAHTLCQATIVSSLFWRVRINGRQRFEYVNVWTSILSKTETKIFVFQKFLDAYGQGLRAWATSKMNLWAYLGFFLSCRKSWQLSIISWQWLTLQWLWKRNWRTSIYTLSMTSKWKSVSKYRSVCPESVKAIKKVFSMQQSQY